MGQGHDVRDNIFCGSVFEMDGRYGPWFKLSFSEGDIRRMTEHLDNGWVKLRMSGLRKPTDKRTHYCEIDTWRPQKRENNRADDRTDDVAAKPEPQDDQEAGDENMPF